MAVVLSGGGMSAIMLELGFLQRLRESSVWDRVRTFFGASAGALAGTMAVLDRLDDLDSFLIALQPDEAFRANRLWRLPLEGTHDYVLPRTIAERLGDPKATARAIADAEAELVVVVTDITFEAGGEPAHRLFERAYSSKETPPDEMADAVLASSAISSLVLPLVVGERVATDGGWVRNFPLGYAYDRPEVELIVAFRYESQFPVIGPGGLAAAARRLRRVSKLPPARAVASGFEDAVDRHARGLPPHIVDIFSRLSRVAIIRNTAVEELVADWRDRSVSELGRLREDIGALVDGDPRLAAAVEERFAQAEFPFQHDRLVPRIMVRGGAGEDTLDPGFRRPKPWTVEAKRRLQQRGRELTDEALRAAGLG